MERARIRIQWRLRPVGPFVIPCTAETPAAVEKNICTFLTLALHGSAQINPCGICVDPRLNPLKPAEALLPVPCREQSFFKRRLRSPSQLPVREGCIRINLGNITGPPRIQPELIVSIASGRRSPRIRPNSGIVVRRCVVTLPGEGR